MLPPFIIEQLREREEIRDEREQPTLELPLPEPVSNREEGDPDEPPRGIAEIQIIG